MEEYLGIWREYECEGLDEVLKALDLSFIARKAALMARLTIRFAQVGDNAYTIETSAAGQSVQSNFQLGAPYKDKMPGGRIVQTIIRVTDDAVMECEHGWGSDFQAKTTRKVTDNTMTAVFTVNGISCRRIYKRER